MVKSPIVIARLEQINESKRKVFIHNFMKEALNKTGPTRRVLEGLAMIYAELRLQNEVLDTNEKVV